MKTECSTDRLNFLPAGRREIRALFDGGTITSDAGVLLLREAEAHSGILKGFAECFTDYRDPDLIEHTVERNEARVAPLVVLDEFTSVVYRVVAKIGRAAVSKAIRRGRINRRLVVVSCH